MLNKRGIINGELLFFVLIAVCILFFAGLIYFSKTNMSYTTLEEFLSGKITTYNEEDRLMIKNAVDNFRMLNQSEKDLITEDGLVLLEKRPSYPIKIIKRDGRYLLEDKSPSYHNYYVDIDTIGQQCVSDPNRIDCQKDAILKKIFCEGDLCKR